MRSMSRNEFFRTCPACGISGVFVREWPPSCVLSGISIFLSVPVFGVKGADKSLWLKLAFLLLAAMSSFSSLLKLPLWLSNVDILS